MDKVEKPIRILTVDDHPIFRMGVATIVNSQPDMIIVGEAGNGHEAVTLHRELKPSVVLMDLRMPVLGGVDAISAIIAEAAEANILVLTTYQGDVEALRALKAGARGYLLKNALLDDLAVAIRHVSSGHRYVPAEIAKGLANHAGDATLSRREIAVLRLIAAGNSNALAAQALAISDETVKSHLKNIMAKLDARDRTHAVTIAIERGIIDMTK